jgi:hypothetical protein
VQENSNSADLNIRKHALNGNGKCLVYFIMESLKSVDVLQCHVSLMPEVYMKCQH